MNVKFEEVLRHMDDPDGTHRYGIACGTIAYFSSRMEAVRPQISSFHLRKIFIITIPGLERKEHDGRRLYVAENNRFVL